ncbi:hypothetical protein EZV62_023896 [Acer yangbiense]|uniref:Uncharacterized protein n=1 Tax=Acer yangbiense TaxID=1000413 RepID=A0A5C7H4L5_9ROSI|nr:hypothetical protein EZV62_023896 [Acer yangbiense]
MVELQLEHGLHLLYSKAWRAKDLAEASVFGAPEESFKLLLAYCHRLKEVNPRTVTAMKTNDANQFEYIKENLRGVASAIATATRRRADGERSGDLTVNGNDEGVSRLRHRTVVVYLPFSLCSDGKEVRHDGEGSDAEQQLSSPFSLYSNGEEVRHDGEDNDGEQQQQ